MKMMTKAIAAKLVAADKTFLETGEAGYEIAVKYFCPWGAATWWVVSATPLDAVNGEPDYENYENAKDWHMFGYADLGFGPGCAELGYTLLSELEKINGPMGLKIERDLSFEGNLHEVMAKAA